MDAGWREDLGQPVQEPERSGGHAAFQIAPELPFHLIRHAVARKVPIGRELDCSPRSVPVPTLLSLGPLHDFGEKGLRDGPDPRFGR